MVFLSIGFSQTIDASLYVPIAFVDDQVTVTSGHEAYDFENAVSQVNLGVLQQENTDLDRIELNVFNLITPGVKDGFNDTWTIGNIELLVNHKITIYNSWDQVVFESSNYLNDWAADGQPSGVYRYVILDVDSGVRYVGNLKVEN